MSRFDGWERPAVAIADSPGWIADWDMLSHRRAEADAAILSWAEGLDAAQLAGDLSWHSGSLGRDVTKSRAECIMHFFNHQTHHRGQVHAMLTAAGARPDDTDLVFMPDAA